MEDSTVQETINDTTLTPPALSSSSLAEGNMAGSKAFISILLFAFIGVLSCLLSKSVNRYFNKRKNLMHQLEVEISAVRQEYDYDGPTARRLQRRVSMIDKRCREERLVSDGTMSTISVPSDFKYHVDTEPGSGEDFSLPGKRPSVPVGIYPSLPSNAARECHAEIHGETLVLEKHCEGGSAIQDGVAGPGNAVVGWRLASEESPDVSETYTKLWTPLYPLAFAFREYAWRDAVTAMGDVFHGDEKDHESSEEELSVLGGGKDDTLESTEDRIQHEIQGQEATGNGLEHPDVRDKSMVDKRQYSDTPFFRPIQTEPEEASMSSDLDYYSCIDSDDSLQVVRRPSTVHVQVLERPSAITISKSEDVLSEKSPPLDEELNGGSTCRSQGASLGQSGSSSELRTPSRQSSDGKRRSPLVRQMAISKPSFDDEEETTRTSPPIKKPQHQYESDESTDLESRQNIFIHPALVHTSPDDNYNSQRETKVNVESRNYLAKRQTLTLPIHSYASDASNDKRHSKEISPSEASDIAFTTPSSESMYSTWPTRKSSTDLSRQKSSSNVSYQDIDNYSSIVSTDDNSPPNYALHRFSLSERPQVEQRNARTTDVSDSNSDTCVLNIVCRPGRKVADLTPDSPSMAYPWTDDKTGPIYKLRVNEAGDDENCKGGTEMGVAASELIAREESSATPEANELVISSDEECGRTSDNHQQGARQGRMPFESDHSAITSGRAAITPGHGISTKVQGTKTLSDVGSSRMSVSSIYNRFGSERQGDMYSRRFSAGRQGVTTIENEGIPTRAHLEKHRNSDSFLQSQHPSIAPFRKTTGISEEYTQPAAGQRLQGWGESDSELKQKVPRKRRDESPDPMKDRDGSILPASYRRPSRDSLCSVESTGHQQEGRPRGATKYDDGWKDEIVPGQKMVRSSLGFAGELSPTSPDLDNRKGSQKERVAERHVQVHKCNERCHTRYRSCVLDSGCCNTGEQDNQDFEAYTTVDERSGRPRSLTSFDKRDSGYQETNATDSRLQVTSNTASSESKEPQAAHVRPLIHGNGLKRGEEKSLSHNNVNMKHDSEHRTLPCTVIDDVAELSDSETETSSSSSRKRQSISETDV
ncbi:Hypp4264 [Branchiostoma lanceolatum]|uniref:Hypp4264 protein n=1 Tax=Branchiostoma lanceolatum TaxID=7740 RepID=A0A8K0A838_BRALA|nr:Hypp4264 [Branchiostoma lanceolatum]